jgi:sulfotransferase family protein
MSPLSKTAGRIGGAAPSTSPFFIVGSERSGTTLLMAILGEHSRLAVPEVAWYYPRFRRYLHTYGDLEKPDRFRTLVSEMIFGLKTAFFGLDLNPATIVDELVARTRAPSFAEAYGAILGFYAEQRRARTRDHKPLGQPVSTEDVGHYRSQLSLHDQGVFHHVAGTALRDAGYPTDVPPVPVSAEEAALYLELDGRIRAATLDAPEGHIVFESYNDWLIDEREERRRRGVWSGGPAWLPRFERLFDWDEEFTAGQRAPRRWKQHLAVKRRHHSSALVL